MNTPENSPLGHGKTVYPNKYDKSQLFPIARPAGRPFFYGWDLWNAWEISWLNIKGKPMVAIGVLQVPCHSPNLIESKSIKLYLNSFNSERFDSITTVEDCIARDLTEAAGAPVEVKLSLLDAFDPTISRWQGINLDNLDIEIHEDNFDPTLLKLMAASPLVSETLISDLLKSNCPVTGQPDWASLRISYTGPQLDRESVLRFILSFRNHNDFHEHCVEEIFAAVQKLSQPSMLTVEARYTRRGGIDINPLRTTVANTLPANSRMIRQ